MSQNRRTLLAALLGCLAGVGIAAGTLARTRHAAPRPAGLPPNDARLLSEVMGLIHEDYVEKIDDHQLMSNAVRGMVMSTQTALAKSGMTWDDIQWFVPHQANLRINEKVVEVAKIPTEKVLNTIEFYGNTTAATVPLTIDHWRQHGKVQRGDRILSSVFGSGFTWGAAIFTF